MATKRRATKKQDDVRSVRHGNITYSSRPSDNTDCRIRCSPPSRKVNDDGSKQTTVRYRHRTLDIKSPANGKRKPGTRTSPKTVTKTTAGKTAAKPTVKQTSKTAAKKTTVRTAPKKPIAKKTAPNATKTTILSKAAKEGMNAKELDKHLVVASVPKIESKPTKKPVAKASAKTVKTASTPVQSRGVAGKFDQKQMKEIISFVDRMNGRSKNAEPMRIPIFRQSATFVGEEHVMMVRVTSRIPGKSLVGLPVSKTRADIWVPQKKIKERLMHTAKDVQSVEYSEESFKGDGAGKLRFVAGNMVIATQAYDYYGWEPKVPPLFNKRDPGDIVFRTTQSKFAGDMKKAMDTCPQNGNCAIQVCPGGKYSQWDMEKISDGCSIYHAKYMNGIVNIISKAKNSSCVVIYRPECPVKVVCDFGMYLVEILLAPIIVRQE